MLFLLFSLGFEKGLKSVLRSIHSYLGPVPMPLVKPNRQDVQLSEPVTADGSASGVPQKQVHLDFGRISKAIDFNTGAPLYIVEPMRDQPPLNAGVSSTEGHPIRIDQVDEVSAEVMEHTVSPENPPNEPDADDSDVIIAGEYKLNEDGTTMETREKDGKFTTIGAQILDQVNL